MTFDASAFRDRAMALGKLTPDAAAAFNGLHKAAFSAGALSVSHKELMALAISVATGCEDCCGYHLDRALAAGATAEEVSDALAVAVAMGGGPAYTYAAKAAASMPG